MTEIKKPIDLQKRANEIQEELKEVIKQNYIATKIHNIVMVVLTVIIIVLTIFTLFHETGRYAISIGQEGKVFVLDTKTSRLWRRAARRNAYFGTNETPKRIFIESTDEQKQ